MLLVHLTSKQLINDGVLCNYSKSTMEGKLSQECH